MSKYAFSTDFVVVGRVVVNVWRLADSELKLTNYDI